MTINTEQLTTSIVTAFLFLTLLSSIGSAVAEVIGEIFGIRSKHKRLISTAFCSIVVAGWNIGVFLIIFGPPKVMEIPFAGVDIFGGFFRLIDIVATALIVGSGSGFVADTFTLVLSKMKEAREISKLRKKGAQGDNVAVERLDKVAPVKKVVD